MSVRTSTGIHVKSLIKLTVDGCATSPMLDTESGMTIPKNVAHARKTIATKVHVAFVMW